MWVDCVCVSLVEQSAATGLLTGAHCQLVVWSGQQITAGGGLPSHRTDDTNHGGYQLDKSVMGQWT